MPSEVQASNPAGPAAGKTGSAKMPEIRALQKECLIVVFEHGIESNNTGRTVAPIAVTLTPSPELVVTAIAAPSVGQPGQMVTLDWTVVSTSGNPSGALGSVTNNGVYTAPAGLPTPNTILVKAVDHANAAGDLDTVARLVLEHMQPTWASGRVNTHSRFSVRVHLPKGKVTIFAKIAKTAGNAAGRSRSVRLAVS